MNRPIQAPVYRRILTVLTCCMVSLFAAGCGAGQTETIAPAGTDPAGGNIHRLNSSRYYYDNQIKAHTAILYISVP